MPSSKVKVLVLVHGLCRNDWCWERDGHNHGAELARDLPYTTAYLHYNTGLHISTNGRAFAQVLEELVSAWPVPLNEVSIRAHSMGGLVARSAHHYATAAGYVWPGKLRKLVFLGTPHHGVPLERAGHWFELLLERTPFTAPFALLGRVSSAGITDLRHGSVLE
jgi:pimeloyl-ACP methyl ester carboxylesterase